MIFALFAKCTTHRYAFDIKKRKKHRSLPWFHFHLSPSRKVIITNIICNWYVLISISNSMARHFIWMWRRKTKTYANSNWKCEIYASNKCEIHTAYQKYTIDNLSHWNYAILPIDSIKSKQRSKYTHHESTYTQMWVHVFYICRMAIEEQNRCVQNI